MKINKHILLVVSFLSIGPAWALVTCSPSSCSPGCDSSCIYYTCTGNASHSFTVNQLPVAVDVEPSNACSHVTVTANSLPFNVDATAYNSLTTNVSHQYKICQAQTASGPACPPPPPPPL